jgi:hypothetical protein
MKKATLYIRPDSFLLNNNMFNAKTFGNRMKSDGYPFVELKKKLADFGVDLSTQDINKPEDSTYIFCLDYPHHFKNFKKQAHQFLYLIITEPEIYCPESWDPVYHGNFDKVFTYNPRFGFSEKYKKYTFAIDLGFYKFPEKANLKDFESRKLCALVANAVLAVPQKHPDSLLHERYKIISWFGKHHPTELDFYSSVCKEKDYYCLFRGIGLVKKILPAYFYKKFVAFKQRDLIHVFRGTIDPLEKINELKKYRFYICYENIKNNEGYITEKIFDCFYAHCIPIYLGANNIADVIPASCFINARKFKDTEEMYAFIKNMPYNDYIKYIESIDAFLGSGQLQGFSVETYADTLVAEMNLKNN